LKSSSVKEIKQKIEQWDVKPWSNNFKRASQIQREVLDALTIFKGETESAVLLFSKSSQVREIGKLILFEDKDETISES